MFSLDQIQQGRILAVDDDADNLMLLSGMLRLAGFPNVQITQDPTQVVDLCEALRPDVLLLDWQMPVRSGRDVLEAIRGEIGGTDKLPVLVLTADTRTSSRHEALLAGATDFLPKPIDEVELLLRMRNLLQMRLLAKHFEDENQALEDRVRERTDALVGAQMQFLERLAAAAELRDDLTGKHTARVARTSGLIAETLGLGAEEISQILHAAPLHDVGKLAVPETILRKPARLTRDEYDIMKTHTVYGPRLLVSQKPELLPLLRTAEEIAATHHERWDGKGYPSGLGEQDIPLSGRIVAVADVYDALTHERPYKAAWSLRESVAAVREMSRVYFDPLIVEVFMNLAEDGRLDPEPEGEWQHGGLSRKNILDDIVGAA